MLTVLSLFAGAMEVVVESQTPPESVAPKVSEPSKDSTPLTSNENSNSSSSLVPERKNSLNEKPGPSRYCRINKSPLKEYALFVTLYMKGEQVQ
jgi:hypothetical protein